jgi:parvulin-like peptidyl-prolyl isomerase
MRFRIFLMMVGVTVVAAACASPPVPADPTASGATPAVADPATPVPPTAPVEQAPTPEEPLAALVNGQPVYLSDYERALGQYEADLRLGGIDPDSPEGQAELDRNRAWILNVMIERVLTEQAAAAAGVNVSDEQVDAYLQEMIAENGGEEAFRAKLEARGETLEDARAEIRAGLIGMAMMQRISEQVPTTAEHVHARHILVDTQAEAQNILAQVRSGADFAALAQAYSLDTSTKESGGDLGFFPRGILVAQEVEDAAFALQPGQVSEVVASPLGYHIVQVVERDPAREVSPENLRILQDQAIQRWVGELWAQADVQRLVELP